MVQLEAKSIVKMSDVVRNLLATAIVDNSTEIKCLQPYVQTELECDGADRELLSSMEELPELSRKSFGQFRIKKLQWLNDGDVMCKPTGDLRPKNPPKGSTVAVPKKTKRKETFCQCGAHDQRTITKKWNKKLDEIGNGISLQLSQPGFFAPQHCCRNELLCSSNLEEVLMNRTVYVWFPHAVTPTMTLDSVVCWTEGCTGGTITMCRINRRIVEGVDSLNFLLFAEFRCSKCKRDKSSLDAVSLTKMGFPCSVVQKMPVVELHDSLWTRGLFEDFASSVTSKLGPGDFANLIEEKRTATWLAEANAYLLAFAEKRHAHGWTEHGFQSLVSPQAFPSRDSHCNGYIGSAGPSAAQFAKMLPTVFKSVELLGDLFMASLGGEVLSADATFKMASATKIIDGVDVKTIFNVMNAHQQVLSWRYTAGEGDGELKGVSEELLDRYINFGGMVQSRGLVKRQPVFMLDRCCAGVQWLKQGGWEKPLSCLDNHHLQQRFAAVATHAAYPYPSLQISEGSVVYIWCT